MTLPIDSCQDIVSASSTAVGIYVHIPFCRTKCIYCDFNCYAGQDRLIPPYVEALAEELRLYGQQGLQGSTLYFGGGTPSLLTPAQVGRIVDTARWELRLDPGAEITLEVNPGSVDEAYAAAVRAAGINRASVGIQSFYDDDLKRLARHHTVAEAITAFQAVRAGGIGSVSLDLIYGLPNQTMERWEYNVRRALDLEPEHISLYALQVEEGTPLARLVARRKVQPADDDLMADMYERAHELMSDAGLSRYEISSWARPGHESAHNRIYWRNLPFVGAGAGAHGYLGGRRYSNERVPSRYVELVRSGSLSVVDSEEIPAELERAETVILGLRLEEGVSREAFEERHGLDMVEEYGAVLDAMEAVGLLGWDQDRLCLTDRGKLLSNEVFQRLLPGVVN